MKTAIKTLIASSLLLFTQLSFGFDFGALVGNWHDSAHGISLSVVQEGDKLRLQASIKGEVATDILSPNEGRIRLSDGQTFGIEIGDSFFTYESGNLIVATKTSTYTLLDSQTLEFNTTAYVLGYKAEEFTVVLERQ